MVTSVSIVLDAAALAAISIATPVPDPTPVAVNNTPTVLATAPISVKSVVPTVLIVYDLPTVNVNDYEMSSYE